jgi:ribose transport system substrate-binding protein
MLKKKIMIWLVSVTAFTLCIGFSSASFGVEKKRYHFILIPKLVHPWYQDVLNGANEAAELINSTGKYDVRIEWNAPTVCDPAVQVKTIEAAIAKRPDGISIAAVDSDAVIPVIDKGIDMGICMTCFDVDAPKSKRLFYAGRWDCTPDGAKMGEFLAKEINYEGEVAMLLGTPTALNHQQRNAGFRQVIAKYPKIKIVAEAYDNDDLERAVSLTRGMIAAHPNLKGIFGGNATAPIGICKAIEEAGKVGQIAVPGEEDLPEMIEMVEKGVTKATLVQRVHQEGFWIVMEMWYYLDRGHRPPQIFDTATFWVYKKDLDVYTQWK